VFLSGTHAVGMNNSFAVRFLACKFQYQSEYGIVSTTNTMNLVVSDCQFNSISVGTLGADVFIAVSSSNITIRDSDFEGGSVMLSLPAGGDQIAIKGNYIEGKTTVAPIYFGATTTSVDISNNSIGFNTGTQIWRNVVGGTLTYNVFWDQPQSVDATCVDFDISHNTFKGSSNVIYRKWAAPTLLNSFTNVGGTWAVAGYTKDKTGTVSLKGMITAATDNVGFTLPSGYRPGEDMRFSSLGSTSLAGNIFINGATGAVTIARSANGSIDLSCVRFMAGA